MIDIVQRSLFDYSALDSDTRAFVQEKAQAIHARLKRTAEDIIAIGQDLLEVNEKLAPHGKFHNWLRCEFDMSRQTAYRFMAVAKKFGSCNIMLQHSPTALYSLLDTPDVIVEQVETGQIPATLPAIREAKQEQQAINLVSNPAIGISPLYSTYTPPDATSQLLQGTQVAKEALEHPILNTLTSKSNEWYTPGKYIDAARELMCGIDLDPASNPTANETVKAARYYTITDNGLDKDWTGRVWLNPPYGRDEAGSNQDVWSRRLIEQYNAGITTEAVLLVNAAVDTKWFQRLFDYPVCFPDHRINFYSPDTNVSGSTHGSSLVYFGNNPDGFYEIFKEFGTVVRRW